MLETIREYGLKALAESGEAETTQQAHALYYLTLAEQSETELRGSAQAAWLERLEAEHDNLRAALRWAHSQGRSESGLAHRRRAVPLLGAPWPLDRRTPLV